MHAFDICLDIASKMKSPHEVVSSMNNQIKRGLFISPEWPTISLAWGISGIICFFGMMDHNFPDEGWDKIACDYLLLAKVSAEANNSFNLSLFNGLTGLSVATYLCSHNGSRYPKMLKTLDDILIREIQNIFLMKADYYLNVHVPIPPDHYNLANGLSGIITYLMCREDHIDLKNLAQECLHYLVKILSTFKEVNGSKVPAWVISSSNEFIPEYKEKFPHGLFKLDIPYGLPGVLAVLSLAKIRGFNVFGLSELISRMSDWIRSKHVMHLNRSAWNHIISMEEELEGHLSFSGLHHDAWIYGNPGILRCLYLASQAMNDSNLAKFAEQTFLSYLLDPAEEMKDTSFCFGKAGLLAITSKMACDTKNFEFFKQMRLQEEEIKKSHNLNHEFGFQTLHYNESDSFSWSDNPSLLHGAAGIGLILLQTQGRQDDHWNRHFGIA